MDEVLDQDRKLAALGIDVSKADVQQEDMSAVMRRPTKPTSHEAWLGGVWQDVLGVSIVKGQDNFFTLGTGDPFELVALLSCLRKAGVATDVATIVANPLLSDMARALVRVAQAEAIPADPGLVCPRWSGDQTLPFGCVPGASGTCLETPQRSIDAALTVKLRDAGSLREGIDCSDLIHAAFALALSRCAGQQSVVFATALGHRWLPFEVDLATETAATLVSSVHKQLADLERWIGSTERQALAQNNHLGEVPVVAVGLSIALTESRLDAVDRVAETSATAINAPMAVIVNVRETSDGLILSAEGFESAEPDRLLDYLVCALEVLLDALELDVPALSLEVMPDAEHCLITRLAKGEAAPYAHGYAIGPWFEGQVKKSPNAIALVCGDSQLTYEQLNADANQLAAWLRIRGAGPGSRIGICVARGIGMLVAQLAVLKMGAAYVPLDPSFPADRLAFMADDADLTLLVSDAASSMILPWPAERVVMLEQDFANIEVCSNADVKVLIEADDPAYLIYTSGSTGKPKGVVVTNRNVANFIGAIQRTPGLRSSDRLLAVTTLSFDIHVLELLAPLCTGAQIVLADAAQCASGDALCALLERHKVTMMQATPSTWNLMIDTGWKGALDLKALVGGEALPSELASQLLPLTDALWNMYGPTEATVWSHCCHISDATEISIGGPLANVSCKVVDPAGRSCPIGVAGELLIGGDAVAAGYWKRSSLTDERFISDVDAAEPLARMYRTGDRVVWLAHGVIQHLGRLDQQVKLRGHRIEPGEIEFAVEARPEVAQCICVLRNDSLGDPRLVAFARCRQPLDVPTLLAHLRQSLPDYMVPQHVVMLEHLPLLPNGKVDRQALPDPDWTVHENSTPQALIGPVEEALGRIWAEVLKLDEIGRHDDFFALGGHSLAAMRVLSRIEKAFDRRLRMVSLFESPTLAAQARLIALSGMPTTVVVVPIQPGGTRPPIFFVSGYGGPILLLKDLARELGPDQPLFLLDFSALDASQFDSIKAAAQALLIHMRAHQPVGPYHLAGYSLGALIAYEMGQHLIEDGQSVPMLAMLDRFAPGHPRLQPFLTRLGLHVREASHKSAHQMLPYFRFFTVRLLRRLAHRIGVPIDPKMPGESAELETLNLDDATLRLADSSDGYVFQPYPGPLMFIRVDDLNDRGIGTVEPDTFGGWLTLAPNTLAIGTVPGSHTMLLFPEHSRQLALLLSRCMAIASYSIPTATDAPASQSIALPA